MKAGRHRNVRAINREGGACAWPASLRAGDDRMGMEK